MELREKLYKELPTGINNSIYGGVLAKKLGISNEELIELIRNEQKAGNFIFLHRGDRFYRPDVVDVQHQIENIAESIHGHTKWLNEVSTTQREIMDYIREQQQELTRLVDWLGENMERPAVKTASIRESVI